MNFFYPNLRLSQLPTMIGITLLGGLIGGVYGLLHDLLTYSISDEYFTRLKFAQFVRFDMGFPPWLFAAQIGFVAAGAVGVGAGWFVARTVTPVWPTRMAFARAMQAFLLMILIAAAAASVGYIISLMTNLGGWLWNDLCEALVISDVPAFLQVALIHAAGYVGALLGLIVALLHLRRVGRLLKSG